MFDAWIAVGARRPPTGKRSRHKKKSENTLVALDHLLDGHVRPMVGRLKVDQTGVGQVEAVFEEMDTDDYATSTTEHAWCYLNQACQWGRPTQVDGELDEDHLPGRPASTARLWVKGAK